MGLPDIVIEFKKKATSAIIRSERGVVLLLLKDATKQQTITSYASIRDVNKEDWTQENLKYLKLAFLGNPAEVIAVRGAVKDSSLLDVNESKKLFENLAYDWFAAPEVPEGDASSLGSYFNDAKIKRYKKAKAVLPNTAADSLAVVNFATADISVLMDGKVEKFSTAQYCARIAGLLAGLPLNRSSTFSVLDEIVDVKQSIDPSAEIDAGKLIIIFDGEKFKIARGVTSLQTVTEEMPEDFKKIKLVEAADIIRTDILTTYQDNYIGKKNNNYDNKQMFIGAILSYLGKLEDILIDKDAGYHIEIDMDEIRQYLNKNGIDTSEMTEIQIKQANTGSFMAIAGHMKLLDAMEDLMMKITL